MLIWLSFEHMFQMSASSLLTHLNAMHNILTQ